VDIKKIIKNQYVVFIKESTCIGIDLKMHLSRRMVGVVNKSFKLPCLGNNEYMEDME